MSKKAFDKIATGLREAFEIARTESRALPSCVISDELHEVIDVKCRAQVDVVFAESPEGFVFIETTNGDK